jgi:LAO/AO transport system kinase
VFPHTGRACIVGVTGPPGAGKSTLVDRLIALRRAAGERVAVVAVDPSSPFSGGAVLGDRVRMQSHATDAGVFVRSMATRGHSGGLARATVGAVRVLDAAGWPLILIETVGAGQVEIDVAQAADTTVVVVPPGSGDSVQAAKAGLLEVADIFAVNKADLPGADQVVRDLEAMLDLGHRPDGWRPPVVRTVATKDEGVAALWDAIMSHPRDDGRRAAQLRAEVRRLVEDGAAAAAWRRCQGPALEHALAEVAARRLDPVSAAAQIGGEALGNAPNARAHPRQ